MEKKLTITDMARIAVAVACMAVCSEISIPSVVPFTLQTFGVFFALEVLGGKRGSIAIIVYILLGAAGVPVFSGFKGGIGVLLGTTGGYIWGFIITGFVYILFEHFFGRNRVSRIAALLIGLALCYLFGTVWFVQVYTSAKGAIGYGTALSWCVFPFIIPDLVKLAAAYVIAGRIRKAVKL